MTSATGETCGNVEPPVAMLAELTHRCPLRCPYCSNPMELERMATELSTATWRDVFEQAARLGVLHVHLSGGEPMVRRDLEELVARAEHLGLYTNLITSGVLLDRERLRRLAGAGLQHVQVSLQDDRPERADEVAGAPGMHGRKLQALDHVRAVGLPLTINVVLHRRNVERIDELVALALDTGASRLELAHVQYHGWASANVAALLPDDGQIDRAVAKVDAARQRLRGRLAIDHVLPDYLSDRPKACMSGWGRRFLVIDPRGRVLPCHHAASLPGLTVPTVDDTTLHEIWYHSALFGRFRGTSWMPEPCRSCPERERDWGGCRCQAFSMTGDMEATDPACALSPHRARMLRIREDRPVDSFVYRSNP